MHSSLQKIRELRQRTSGAFTAAYKELQLHKPFTEADLRDNWLSKLRLYPDLYHEGWYNPPPSGIICTFAKADDNYSAIKQPSFRPPSTWPKEKIMEPEDISLVYASPIQKLSSLIGDWALCIYSGSNAEIRDHFRNSLQATLEVASKIESGMAFSDLYETAIESGTKRGLNSTNVHSISDAAGINIGHTIPLSLNGCKTYEDTKNAISTGRVFINRTQSSRVEENTAFVIEPRYSTQNLPDILFHITIVMIDGVKFLCHEYHPALEATGMRWLARDLPE